MLLLIISAVVSLAGACKCNAVRKDDVGNVGNILSPLLFQFKRMLGLGRPRLRTQNSLLDLLEATRLSSSTISISAQEGVDDLPPLPSPLPHTPYFSNNLFAPSTPLISEELESSSAHPSPIMAPSKTGNDREDSDDDRQTGTIYSISGPVIVAENMLGCAMYELVKVGNDQIIGEVIRIDADKATIQVYEETYELPLSTIAS